MPDQERQQSTTTTTSSSNFDVKADKWFESRWVLVGIVASIIVPILVVWSALQLSDSKQSDAIANLDKNLTVFQNGDFKDLKDTVNKIQEQQVQERLDIQSLKTLIDERLPKK